MKCKFFLQDPKFRLFLAYYGLGLHEYLADSIKSEKLKIPPDLINRLIGRLIYTYLLTDKKVINVDGWERDTAGGENPLEQQSSDFWTLQDRIDEIFNGGIFQISEHLSAH